MNLSFALPLSLIAGVSAAAYGQGARPTTEGAGAPAASAEAPSDHRSVFESGTIPAKSLREAGTGFLVGLGASGVLFDTPGDGRIWAAADRYKASFGSEGATYIPFFGSEAPENHPVHFAIRSIQAGETPIAFDAEAEPVRHGDRIVFDRGVVDEVYELSLDSIEQSFVFDALPERGELVIELAASSSMSRSADAKGLVFTSGFGSVRYTNAVAIDARGERAVAPTAWDDEGISIRVAASDVARADFPLVVDPVLSTFDVDVTTQDDLSPDIAYDATTNRWLAVYERVFSASDHDVYSKLLNLDGSLHASAFIDSTDLSWGDPSVANNNQNDVFMVVAEVGFSPDRSIRARPREATGLGTLGSQFFVSVSISEGGEAIDPSIGGDQRLTVNSYHCVAYTVVLSSSDTNVHVRMIQPYGVNYGPIINLSNSTGTLDGQAAVSKGSGIGPAGEQGWNVVFARNESLFDHDLYAAQIGWDGDVITPVFALDTSSLNTTSPSVSSPLHTADREYLVAYTLAPLGGTARIYGKLMRGTTTLDTVNLSSITGAPTDERQIHPCVDSDGHSFVLVHAESYAGGSSDYDVYASTLAPVGSRLLVSEGHENLAFSTLLEDRPRIACPEAAGETFAFNRPAFAIWQEQSADGDGDIEAATYDLGAFASLCTPGVDGFDACVCGNPPVGSDRGCNNSAGTGGARLSASGQILGDSVVLTAQYMLTSSLCIFGQGTSSLSSGTSFGDGIRCVTGTLLRLATKSASAGAASFPVGADPSITERSGQLGNPIASGERRFYYTYYRDPASFGCTATFNSTNTVLVQW